MRNIETRLWEQAMAQAEDAAAAFAQNPILDLVMRRIQSLERAYQRALAQIRQIRKEDGQPPPWEPEEGAYEEDLPDEEYLPGPREGLNASGQEDDQLGSFSPGEEEGGDAQEGPRNRS